MASASNMPASVRLAHTKAESIPLLLAVAYWRWKCCRHQSTVLLASSKPPSNQLANPTETSPSTRCNKISESASLEHHGLSHHNSSKLGRSGMSLRFQTPERAMVVTTPVLIPSASSFGRMVSTSPVTCKHPFKRSRARGWPGAWLGFAFTF